MTPLRKQAQSEGTSGPWFYAQGVKPGEWYTETKARTRAAMLATDWPEKQRVWACLSLHTMGFGRELAVRMEKGQTVPLRQADIARETGIALKSVHRCVVELEREGWLLRETAAAGAGGTELQIHCYALPRKPKAGEANPSTAPARPVYDGLPEELAYWLRHLKLGIPTGEKLEEARALAEELSDRAARFRACCKPEPKQMELPGVSANRATVAESKKPGPRAVESLPARGRPEPEPGSRAEPICLGARRSSNRKIRTDMNEVAVPPHGSVLPSAMKNERESVGRSTVDTNKKRNLPTDSPYLQEIQKTILKTGICEKLKDTPGPGLLARISESLKGNPADSLGVRIHLRFDRITSLGMLVGLAADVAAASGSPEAPRKETWAEKNARIDRELAEEEKQNAE